MSVGVHLWFRLFYLCWLVVLLNHGFGFSCKLRVKIIGELHHPGHFDIRDENQTGVFVIEGRQFFKDRSNQFFRDGRDDHDEGIIFVEHHMAGVASVTSLPREIVNDGLTLDAGRIEEVRDKNLMLASQNDLQFLNGI